MDLRAADLSQLIGKTLTEAVDLLHAQQAELAITRLVQLWGNESPPIVYLLPFVARPFWASFGPLRRRPLIRPSNDPLEVTHTITGDMYQRLFEDRFEWFEKATDPLLQALASGVISVTGIQEPADRSSWERRFIPQGLFETGRWELRREESRLVALDAAGAPTTVLYIASRIEAPATRAASILSPAPNAGPSATAKPETEFRTGLPGRPSMKEWTLKILEERAKKGLLAELLRTESSEILKQLKRDYPGWPNYGTERTIENLIRVRYRELKATK